MADIIFSISKDGDGDGIRRELNKHLHLLRLKPLVNRNLSRGTIMRRVLNKLSTGFLGLFVTFGAFTLLMGNASAQDSQAQEGYGLDEIIVTATRRERSLQDVALTVTALPESLLEAQGLDEAIDWVRSVPGLTFSEISAGQRNGVNFVVRGVSNTRFFDAGSSAQTTSFQLDDVGIQPVDAKLFDINRVEVLKGPQGTLFGQSSMGGTVRMFTNQPDSTKIAAKFRTSVFATEGGDESFTADVMVNVPVIEDVLAVRGVVSFDNLGGWIDRIPANLDLANNPKDPSGFSQVEFGNRYLDSQIEQDVNQNDSVNGRISVKYTPTEQLTIQPLVMFQSREADFDDTYHRNLLTDFGAKYLTIKFIETPRTENFRLSKLDVAYDFGIGTLSSITASTERNFRAVQDLTMSGRFRHGLNQDGSIPAPNPFDFYQDISGFSQELRFTGEFELGGALSAVEYVVGGFYQEEETFLHLVYFAPDWNANADNNNFISDPFGVFVDVEGAVEFETTSFYADATLRFGRLAITGGLRAYDQEFRAPGNILRGEAVGSTLTTHAEIMAGSSFVAEDGVIPRASVSYEITPNHLTYFIFSEGFRIGGAETVLDSPECNDALMQAGLPSASQISQFDSDEIKNYEIGFKSTWLDNRLQVNLSAYHMEWTGLQRTIELNQLNNGCGAAVTQNIGAAEIDGAEAEVNAAIGNILVGGTVAIMDAAVSEAPPGTLVPVGTPLGAAPDLTASAYLQYGFPLAFGDADGNVRIDYAYRDNIFGPNFVDPSFAFTQHSDYYVLNFSATASSEKWGTFTLFVNNLTDQIGDHGGAAQFGEPFSNDVTTIRPLHAGIRYSREF